MLLSPREEKTGGNARPVLLNLILFQEKLAFLILMRKFLISKTPFGLHKAIADMVNRSYIVTGVRILYCGVLRGMLNVFIKAEKTEVLSLISKLIKINERRIWVIRII